MTDCLQSVCVCVCVEGGLGRNLPQGKARTSVLDPSTPPAATPSFSMWQWLISYGHCNLHAVGFCSLLGTIFQISSLVRSSDNP